ncbi:membrane anchor subunit of succinate dehydrogenase, Sdh4 [Apophysomyces sp. BC1034]|nr:membrane anchor subunit of succinate dehydrogenase, Sdh4 [Apophysomyces sp. BC1021]KAG0193403.1 membrane anchor subunit of succinate dehydrogenase, Sdh4 [Apophysomyces sp. BC1034]
MALRRLLITKPLVSTTLPALASRRAYSDEPAAAKVNTEDEKEAGYVHGTFHWTIERASAVALIPLISTQMIYGAHPISDGLLGVVLPYHVHMGFDACITDYIPKRVYPRLHRVANWTLMGTTGLVMWGCYEFNTNDVGLTEVIQRIWAA